MPAEYITLIWHVQCLKEEVLYKLEIFMTRVLLNLVAPAASGITVGGRI